MKTLARTLCCLVLASLVAGLDSAGAQGQAQRGGPQGGFQRGNRPPRQMRPVIRGTEYAATSMSVFATRAAVQILEAGGNAFDAIVAGHAVLALVDADSNGIGSDAVILLYDAESRRVISVDAEGTAPQLATIDWYNENNNGEIPRSNGLLSATVPGMVDAWYTLLDRWGTMTFEEVLQPAIEVAGEGFPISESFARALGSRKLAQYPSSVKLYNPDTPRKAGEIFRNPDAARTLERLVEAEQAAAGQGRRAALRAARDLFYKGDIAREMATFAEENGGLFRYEDFAEYGVRVEAPISVDYRGYQVYKNPSSNQGPAELFALNILEGYDLAAMGHNSADYVHHLVEAMRRAFRDRAQHVADVDFADVPLHRLTSKDYAATLRGEIDAAAASVSAPSDIADVYESLETTHYSVVDRNGMAVSVTYTLEGGYGSGITVPGAGFLLNNEMGDFNAGPGLTNTRGLIGTEPNLARPEQRMLSSMTPSILAKDGELVAVVGSPGGRTIINTVLQVLLNMIEFDMNVQEAVTAPRLHHQWLPDRIRIESGGVSVATAERLRRLGHTVSVGGSQGIAHSIMIDPETGDRLGAADARNVDAVAVGN